MTDRPDSDPLAAPISSALLSTWLAQSHDLLALTDASGRIAWSNSAFTRVAGLAAHDNLLKLTPPDWHGGKSRSTLLAALQTGSLDSADLLLCSATGAKLWVQPRLACVGADFLWTLRDTTESRELADRARHVTELLDMAQEFGRLGVWERQIPSGDGRWDRHVFGFWGMEPRSGTPNYVEAASRIHPDDRRVQIYSETTRKAGRYAQRYRVIQPNGNVRWIHSQWEVKNSPLGVPDRTIGIMVDDTESYELARSLDSTAAQLKLAVDLGHIVIWRQDLKTDRIHYNDQGYAMLGITPREDGLPIAEAHAFTHPDDVSKLAASAVKALRSSEPIDVEIRQRRVGGEWRYMLLRRTVERSSTGEPIAFVGVSLDVTDQFEQSRRAEQLSRRLEAAAKAAHVGIWTTVIGSLLTEWNAQMYELFDMRDATQPPVLAQWISQCVHPDDQARVTTESKTYLRQATGALELEFRARRRDGQVRWMVLRADIDHSAVEAKRVLGIAMDVTDRHAALAALHAASERAALIARHAGIGTWETDEEGLPALWDEQMFRLRGLQPRAHALTREERLATVHPDDRAIVLDSKPEQNAGSQSTAYEFRVRWPDGTYRWLASRSAALRNEQGKVIRRVGVNWDVTEGKSAELARQQAILAERESRAKSQFLSRMSHELRTPLNAVLGFTQLLQLEAQQSRAAESKAAESKAADSKTGASNMSRAKPSRATERLAKLGHIRSAGEHLLTLINDALDLSSLETGTLKLELQPIPLAAAVKRALAQVADLAAAQRVTLRCGALDGVAVADSERLQQVLNNLLTNAIKYNRAGGEVAVEAITANERVHLSVRDTGRGLQPDQLAHLFEPFNRLGMELEGIEGTGIGLTIVKALVENMGGNIGVSSQPGQGTVFEITLPAGASSGQHHAAVADDARPSSTTRADRMGQLLYIEDNSVNVLLVEELVKSLSGLQIVSEATGAAGVARARELRPDVILIDMQLPDFDGFEVLRQLRAQAETAATPCIALSANAMPDDIERGMKAGFDAYWTKPIKFKLFIDELERLFPNRTPS
jgi:PAS domain S-box-containing protein